MVYPVHQNTSMEAIGTEQDSYAANLTGTVYGLAIYEPVPFDAKSGRVGDIGYFDGVTGRYRTIINAFDREVLPACRSFTYE
jgi:hypothetical protein